MVKVSVVIPVWNGENYLAESVNSVLKQTLNNIEVIIIDDNSSDATWEIVESFVAQDPRVKAFKNILNMKLPETLNIGFSFASGEWYTWISHDNLIDEKFLEEMLSRAAINGSDCVYSNFKTINEQGVVLKTEEMDKSSKIYEGNCVGASFIYKAEIHKALNGYDKNKFLYEDYDFWVRMYERGFKMDYEKIDLYKYRIHQNQLSNTHKYPRDFVQFRWKQLCKINNSSEAFAKTYISLVGLCIRTRNFDLALLYSICSWRNTPVIYRECFRRLAARRK